MRFKELMNKVLNEGIKDKIMTHQIKNFESLGYFYHKGGFMNMNNQNMKKGFYHKYNNSATFIGDSWDDVAWAEKNFTRKK